MFEPQNPRDYSTRTDSIGNRGFGVPAYGAPVPVSASSPADRAAFLRKVYVTFAVGVIIAMASAVYFTQSGIESADSIVRRMLVGRSYLLLFLAYFAITFAVSAVARIKGLNLLAYAFFTAFTGFVISPIMLFAVASTGSYTVVEQALGISCFGFGGLTLYALVSGKDFSFMRGLVWSGFWVLLGFMVVGFFVHSWAFHMGVTAAGILVFIGFVLYDTSNISKRLTPADWVTGALMLFIDFINIFIRVLTLLSSRRS